MKLISIKLNNFRQFYGEQKIEFSKNPNQLITVIHGENGSGKTALLNSFKWVLYGKTDFDAQNKLINERYLAENKNDSELMIQVELEFEHESSRFIATRKQKYKKIEKLKYREIGDSVFNMSYIDTSGNYSESNNASTHIKQILPEDLHSYFFFNGERIDKLANESSSNEIKTAIKKLLGLEILERSISHLEKYVIKTLRKKLRDVSTGDLSEKIDEESELLDEQETLKRKSNLLNKNLLEYKRELNIINAEMEGKKEIKILQKERLKIEEENKEYNDNLTKLHESRRKLISNDGYLAFVKEVIDESNKILSEKRKKGELPSNIKHQFIKDIIERKYCICGRELVSGEEPYKLIVDFLNSTVSQDIEDAFINTSAAIKGMIDRRNLLFERVEDFQIRVSEIWNKVKINQSRLDEISSKIGGIKTESIDDLEAKRIDLTQKIEEAKYQIRFIKEEELRDNEERIQNVRKEIKEIKLNNEKQILADRRLNQANECRRVLISILETISKKVRIELSDLVNSTFKKIMRKDYWAEIGDDYSLDIYKDVGDHKTLVPEKSTGENQVASLSFIGSLVAICKENYEKKGNQFSKGGIFPIVMDSPFGTLDKEYRNLVAKLIPELAHQVIVLVSDSQWSGEVEDELLPRVGKQYTLIYNSPHINKNSVSKSIKKSEKYEFTEITEGNYGR